MRPVAAAAAVCLIGGGILFAAENTETDDLIASFLDRSSLGRIQALELLDASPMLDQATAVSLFQDALRDADPLVGEAALRALLHRDSEQNRVLSEDEASRFQGETAELAKAHFAAMNQDTEALRELMRTGDAVVQESAFNALAAENTSGAIEELKAEFDDRSSLHRLQSLELFLRSGYTNSPEILEPLLRAASDDEDPLVRDWARDTLKEKS